MATAKKQIPEFQSEEDERNFWAKHDSTEYIDWQTAKKRRLPNLKPSLRTNQSLLKVFLTERLERERRRT